MCVFFKQLKKKDVNNSIEFYEKKNMHLNGHNLVMVTTKTVGHDLIYQLSQAPANKKYEQTSRNYIIKTRTIIFGIVKNIVQDLTAILGKCLNFFL